MNGTFECFKCGDVATQVITICARCASEAAVAAPSASTNNRSDEIAFLESLLITDSDANLADIAIDVGRKINDRIAQLRAVR